MRWKGRSAWGCCRGSIPTGLSGIYGMYTLRRDYVRILNFNLLTDNVINPLITAITGGGTDMSGLVPYLLRSHNYYLGKRLPHIGRHLQKIARMLPARAAKVIMRFYDEYIDEVTDHFRQEETIVFPHIESLLAGRPDGYRIKDYLQNHGDLEDKLSDLTQIIFKYLPTESTDDDAIDMIFDILEVGRDLHKHSLIEERILVPYVSNLEKSVEP